MTMIIMIIVIIMTIAKNDQNEVTSSPLHRSSPRIIAPGLFIARCPSSSWRYHPPRTTPLRRWAMRCRQKERDVEEMGWLKLAGKI